MRGQFQCYSRPLLSQPGYHRQFWRTFTCSRGYTIYTGSNGKSMCYKVSVIKRSWQDAVHFCALDGGVLPKIEDAGTNAFLLSLAEECTSCNDPWIGLVCPTASRTDCYWVSVNTTLGSYQNWYSGFYPSGVYTSIGTGGGANDGTWFTSTGPLATFCQKDPVPMSVFMEEARLKRAAREKKEKRGEKMRLDLKL